MRPWQAVLLIIVLAFLAISSGWRVLYLLTYVLLTLFILSWFWTRYSLRKMAFRRTASVGRVQVGEIFDERLMLEQTCNLASAHSLQAARAFPTRSRNSHKRRSIWLVSQAYNAYGATRPARFATCITNQ